MGVSPDLKRIGTAGTCLEMRARNPKAPGTMCRAPPAFTGSPSYLSRQVSDTGDDFVRKRTEARLHGTVAAALEQLPEAKRTHERRAVEPAHHFTRAEEPARALPYALQAGDQDEAAYAHAEAEQQCRTAVELAAGVGDQAREAEACEKQAGALRNLTRSEEALQAIERAAALYQACGDIEGELRALALIANFNAFGWGQEDGCLAWLRPQVESLEAEMEVAGGTGASAGLVAVYCGIAHLHGGRWRVYEAEAAAAHAEQLARTLVDPAVHLHALGARAWMNQALGTGDAVAQACELLTLAEAARSHADLRNAFHMLLNGYLVEEGDFERARVHAERFVELSEQPEAQPNWGEAQEMSGELAY
jgi:tetratricopeptide (TPR) repeat protein